MRQEQKGFFKMTGFEPFTYSGVLITEMTFATKASAEKRAAEMGGKVEPRPADGIMVDGKIVGVDFLKG